ASQLTNMTTVVEHYYFTPDGTDVPNTKHPLIYTDNTGYTTGNDYISDNNPLVTHLTYPELYYPVGIEYDSAESKYTFTKVYDRSTSSFDTPTIPVSPLSTDEMEQVEQIQIGMLFDLR